VRELRVRRQRPESAQIDAAAPAVQPREAAGGQLDIKGGASTMSPTSTILSASTPCRNSFSSRTRACLNPRWMSERNRVRAVVLPVRVGLPFAMALKLILRS
jgi:hypothetical protein